MLKAKNSTPLTPALSSAGERENSQAASLSRFEVLLNQKSTIDDACQGATEHRANPVNCLVVPMAAGQGRAECPCRVHGRAGERSTKQNIERDRKPDCKA